MVGPKVGADLRSKALWSLIASWALMLAYVTWRFEFKFAVGGILALVHDVIISVGIFTLLGRTFSLTVLAAVLTIVGYSINDTIVIYDRIRELLQREGKRTFREIIDLAVNQTLSRSILTSLTVFFVLLVLFALRRRDHQRLLADPADRRRHRQLLDDLHRGPGHPVLGRQGDPAAQVAAAGWRGAVAERGGQGQMLRRCAPAGRVARRAPRADRRRRGRRAPRAARAARPGELVVPVRRAPDRRGRAGPRLRLDTAGREEPAPAAPDDAAVTLDTADPRYRPYLSGVKQRIWERWSAPALPAGADGPRGARWSSSRSRAAGGSPRRGSARPPASRRSTGPRSRRSRAPCRSRRCPRRSPATSLRVRARFVYD